ncbi:response regulator transcription factor [Actinomycetota bacterium]
MKSTVLVVADDAGRRHAVADVARAAGLGVLPVEATAAAIDAYHAVRPDLLVVGSDVPDNGAQELCRRFGSRTPVLVVTADADEIEELLFFHLGADDYVTSDVSPRILLARMRALLRRGAAAAGELGDVLVHGPLRVDRAERRVTVNGCEIHLTRTEFELMEMLLERPHAVVRRTDIAAQLWPGEVDCRHGIEVHMSRLRRKIREAGGPAVGESVRGIGYRLTATPFPPEAPA